MLHTTDVAANNVQYVLAKWLNILTFISTIPVESKTVTKCEIQIVTRQHRSINATNNETNMFWNECVT